MKKYPQLKIRGGKKMHIAALFAALMITPPAEATVVTVDEIPNTVQTAAMQSPKVSLRHSQQPLNRILRDIQSQSGIGYTVSEEVQNALKSVSISVADVTVEDALAKMLIGTGYGYRIVNNLIVIERSAAVQQPANQRITVSGTVRDAETQKPVAGASVVVRGTNNGIATNTNGTFTITIEKGQKITVSYVGMVTEERQFDEPAQGVAFSLKADVFSIGEVVVTGIFDRPRESYTGAVTSISAKELETYRGQNLIQTLRNIDPSINILANNEVGSNPNAIPEITIRGNSSLPLDVQALNEGQKYNLNTPLIIMDGFEISLTKLMDYNDDEIQSINILKDASATAIYGSRGANGVIVIVSKQPSAGQLRINFKASVDMEIPDLSSYDLLNAAEKLQLEWDNGFYESATSPSTDLQRKQLYYQRLADVLAGTDTYWLSKPLRTAVTHKYNLRLEGGSQEFRWGVTTAYNQINGVMKNSHRDNFSGQIVLQYNYKNVTFRNQTEITINKGVESNYGSFGEYSKMNPYYKLHDDNGALIQNFTALNGSANVSNPLYDATLNSINESAYKQYINNFSIEWNIVEGLKLRGSLGLSTQNNTSDVFVPPGHSTFLSNSYYLSGDGVLERGSYTYGTGESNSYDASVTLGYSKVFNDKHQLYAGLDWSLLQRKSYYYTFKGIGYTNDELNSLGNAMFYPNNGKPIESDDFTRSVGFTGNVNYTYDNRYFADASLRLDGSSQFGSKKRFAPFWSIGLGWNIHHESFMDNSGAIDNLRLKASYGQTGSQQFSAYQAMRTFSYYTDNRYGNWGGAYLTSFGNEDLKWQVTDQANIGAEIGLWQNGITASTDFYIKKTSNLLSYLDIPYATGFGSYITNIGEVKNTGFEASLGGYLLRNSDRDILWTINGKIAYNKNEITKLSDEVKKQTLEYLAQDVDVSTLFYEGRSQNALYVVRSLGIDPSTGREVFLDKNGNTVYTWAPSDKVFIGNEEPAYRGNISSMFRYKNLSLNLSFAYHWGGVTYNSTLVNRVEILRSAIPGQNVDRRVLTDRWSQPGDVVEFKKIPTAGETDTKTRASSRFVMKDQVLQLQTASIEYRLDSEWLKRTGIQNARIGLNMSDLLYISSVKRERGTDYPFSRRVGASISLMF